MGKGKRWWLAVVLMLSMVTAIGCEAVGGVDVNRAIISSITDQQSSEGNFTLEWAVNRDPSKKLDEESAKMLRLFGSGTLKLTEMKAEDRQTLSSKGELQLSKGTLPFTLYIADNKVVLDVEGAKKPFLFDMMANSDLEELGPIGEAIDPTGETGLQAMQAIAAFLIKNTPNPEKATFSRVTESINGVNTQLAKIHFEIAGEEFGDLLVQFLNNVVADEAGLKELIGTLYDTLHPVLSAYRDELAKNGADESDLMMFDMMLGNKTFAVEFAYETVAPYLHDAVENIEVTADMISSGINEMFTSDSKVAFSYYIDGENIVGSDFELFIEPNVEENEGIASIAVNSSSWAWNINKDIKADSYNGEVYKFDPETPPAKRLANISPDSLLYDILKKDLAVTKHSFQMYMGEDADVPDGVSPYIKGEGTTMVPVRYVSEQLYAKVLWNGETETITIRSDADDTTIVMTVGDVTAYVNGEAQTLPEAPELLPSGSAFVPIAFIAKSLGGKSTWQEEWGIVTIEKEF